ncbi:hypothetical protein L1987_19457 [Smallanthus sonchifolius]|uniref:Uncharacterized protein n=1 Tax=Smallanthus sonchifolius TaxID=185202 RepID=A0ACB9IR66_9ASTR|nr:hypothetical protein L1987_19457 [Smallanthus sonchifolius]
MKILEQVDLIPSNPLCNKIKIRHDSGEIEGIALIFCNMGALDEGRYHVVLENGVKLDGFQQISFKMSNSADNQKNTPVLTPVISCGLKLTEKASDDMEKNGDSNSNGELQETKLSESSEITQRLENTE